MSMQVDEQLPVRQPVAQQMRSMHRQRGLARPGMPSIALIATTPPRLPAPAATASTWLNSQSGQ